MSSRNSHRASLTSIAFVVLAAIGLVFTLASADELDVRVVALSLVLAASGGFFWMTHRWGEKSRHALERARHVIDRDTVLAEAVVWKRSSPGAPNTGWMGYVNEQELTLVPLDDGQSVESFDLTSLRSIDMTRGVRSARLELGFGGERFELRSLKSDLGRIEAAIRTARPDIKTVG